MKAFLLFISFFVSQLLTAQVTGTVKDETGHPLPYASIIVKGSKTGVMANSEGRFTIALTDGQHTLVAQFVGYASQTKDVKVSGGKASVDFVLNVQELQMNEIVIKRGEDPAIEIMKNAIAKREYYRRQVDSFTADVYIKGLMRTREVPDRVFGKKIDIKGGNGSDGLDSLGRGIIFLSESMTKVAYKKPDKYKYEVVSTRQSGGGFGLSFPFFIDFYAPNISVFDNNLNPRGFVSPLSDNAFHFYKFRFEGSFFEGDKMIDKIRVTPRRKNEPLFDGYIQIVDEDWRIHSLDLLATKDYQLDLIDSIRISQIHAPVKDDIWRTQNQVVYVAAKFFGFDVTGNFLNVYNNYNVNPGFGRKFFDRILMKYDTAANRRDSIYWNTTRPVALEPDEKQNFQLRDSVRQVRREAASSQEYIDSVRRLRKRLSLQDFVFKGASTNFYSKQSFKRYEFKSLISRTQFNTVEGVNITADQSLNVIPHKANNRFNIRSVTRYGFSNQHLNSYATVTVRPKQQNYRNRYLAVSGGKRVSQFNHNEPIDELTNTFFTLLYKRNYMKVYENWFGSVEYNNRFDNGLRWNVSSTFERRMPVQNTTDFSFFSKEVVALPNHPYELENLTFSDHNALTVSVRLSYQPGQRYIQFPRSKVPIGSKYPTFELEYSKGIPNIFNSITDFDKWRFSVHDNMNLKLLGTFRYRLGVGGFLNSHNVQLPDLQHFNGNQTFTASEYLNSFQMAPYYRYSNAEQFYSFAHAEHHFNGLLTNKLPLFNRLKWNLVAGANTFYVNNDNYYVELFAGLENIFKIFRVDVVAARQAATVQSYGVRIGMGGILGSSLNVRRR